MDSIVYVQSPMMAKAGARVEIMKFSFALIMALTVLSSVGCIGSRQPPAFTRAPEPVGGKGLLYLYRHQGALPNPAPVVRVAGQPVFVLEESTYMWFQLPEGEQTVEVDWLEESGTKSELVFSVSIAEGQTRIIRLVGTFGEHDVLYSKFILEAIAKPEMQGYIEMAKCCVPARYASEH